VPDDGTPIVRTNRETSQPNLVDLEYWATGVSAVYLQGALERALVPAFRRAKPAAGGPPLSAPVLDPYSALAKGEPHLWAQLRRRSPRYLHQMIRMYNLASEGDGVDAMTTAELTAFIILAVRSRLVA
jgi:hypothetical protein